MLKVGVVHTHCPMIGRELQTDAGTALYDQVVSRKWVYPRYTDPLFGPGSRLARHGCSNPCRPERTRVLVQYQDGNHNARVEKQTCGRGR
jgi:hypothetical protein